MLSHIFSVVRQDLEFFTARRHRLVPASLWPAVLFRLMTAFCRRTPSDRLAPALLSVDRVARRPASQHP